MCTYCGCRAFPLIDRLSDEHEEITDAAARLRRLLRAGRTDDAWAALDDLVGLLGAHTAVEEDGLFAELRAEGSLTEAVAKLCAEHRDIHGVLDAVDPAAPDWPAVLAALDRLHRHIDSEEHGLFPAAVTTLPIDAWDRITPPEPAGSSQPVVVFLPPDPWRAGRFPEGGARRPGPVRPAR